jgi:hypothetical protein
VKRRDLERHLRAKLDPMTTREKAHKLLDELPEFEIEPVVEFMASRKEDPVPQVIDLPVDDEQPTAEEEAAATKSPERRAAIEFLRRLDSGEDDRFDWSVSERLHASR